MRGDSDDRLRRLPNAARTPPHALEAEMSVLGGLMLDNRKWEEVEDVLSETDFYTEPHRLIFRAIRTLAAKGSRFDWVTVAEWMRDDREDDRQANPQMLDSLERAGGQGFVAQITLDVPGASNVGAYAEIVKQRSVQRDLIAKSLDITALAMDPGERKGAELLEAAQMTLMAVSVDASDLRAPTRLGEGFDALETRMTWEAEHKVSGTSTGFHDIDGATGALRAGDLWVIAGRPGSGKTAFALCIAEYVAAHGTPVAGFSMEMPKEQWLMRLVANKGDVLFNHLRHPHLMDDDDWAGLVRARQHLENLRFYVDDEGALTLSKLRRKLRRMVKKHDVRGAIVDYFQLMEGDKKSRGEQNRDGILGEISRGLKGLAKELGVWIIALSSVSRKVEERDNKRPKMSDLRECGSVEFDADVILTIYADEEYNPDSPCKGMREIGFPKNRSGPRQSMDLQFEGAYMRFSNYNGPSSKELLRQAMPPPKERKAGLGGKKNGTAPVKARTEVES